MAWQTPKTDWTSTDGVLDSDMNRIEGNIDHIENSTRTPNDNATVSTSGPLGSILSYLATMIKKITGETSWTSTPKTTLSAAKSHMDNKSNPHNVTYSQVGAAPSSHTHSGSDITGIVANAEKVNGHKITVSATAPSNPQVNDIWIEI